MLGVQVFGRKPSWNPRADPIVRQEAGRLRKRLAKYYETDSPEVRIELPVGTYVPVFRRAETPTTALAASPAAETARPESTPLTAAPAPGYGHADTLAPPGCGSPRSLLAAGIAGGWRFLRAPGSRIEPSIASRC